jgi:signal transduction histidine kinase
VAKLLALFPGSDWGARFNADDPALLGIAAGLLVALVFLPLIAWERRQWRKSLAESRMVATERAGLEELLGLAPDGLFHWSLSADGEILSEQCSRRLAVLLGLYAGTKANFADVLARFEPTAAAELTTAVETLHTRGIGFDKELALKEGQRRVLVVGARATDADGVALEDALWVRDVTEGAAALAVLSAENRHLAAERDRLAALLDALPMPVWLRDGDLSLTYCNQAYARAVDRDSAKAALEGGVELVPGAGAREARALAARARASGGARAQAFHFVMEGARRLVELAEAPFQAGAGDGLSTVGLAVDHTRQEELQSLLDRQMAAHAEVLEKLGTAIAIFAADTRLTFFNTAFSMLWRLETEWLATQPTYGNLLDVLRDHRRLPEAADYRAFKEEELRRFTSLLEAGEDLLHLPDERTLRRVVSAHPLGGLLFTYEDVTDALALERSHKTSLVVHRETLAHLHEGVAVFSSDGRLRLSNPAYGRIWAIGPDELAGEPHVSAVIERYQRFFTDPAAWSTVRDSMLTLFSERVTRHGRIERADGAILDYASVPLPDGAVLTTWLDVSDSARVEKALRDRNDALAAADRLKSEFIANVSAEVRTPLTTILGFAEMLSHEYFGTLNERQHEYAHGITESGQHLLQVLSDILDLATIEAGQMTLSLNAIDIHAMLTAVLRLIRERLREKQLALDFDCPLDLGWMVADERRIRQVLFNLLSNAVKVAPAHGKVVLSARREAGDIVFVVGGEAAGEASSSGLGLSLVKSFVELHGGTVSTQDGAPLLRIPAGGEEG